MKPHTRIYLEFFGFISKGEKPLDPPFVPCEICGQQAVDIHHIDARGMGGSKTKDVIENLQALCRRCHNQFGDITKVKDKLKAIHQRIIDNHFKRVA